MTDHPEPHGWRIGKAWLAKQARERAEREQPRRPCDVPPPGWRCTRERGHDGPCAAWPDGGEEKAT